MNANQRGMPDETGSPNQTSKPDKTGSPNQTGNQIQAGNQSGGAAIAASILELTKELVNIPTQGGIDSPQAMLDAVCAWLKKEGVQFRLLKGSDGTDKAIVCEVTGRLPGPTICFDACLDTAPVDDQSAWKTPPFVATVVDGWLHGRGCADSKVAVALFCHLARAFQSRADELSGKLVFLFDADEHTGGFAGVKEYIAQCDKPDALAIGYPGNDAICIGARGFYRVEIDVFGLAAHSGSSSQPSQNAVLKAAQLATALGKAALPAEYEAAFHFGPKMTVTAINGGKSFATVPDKCTVSVDTRLTPAFTQDQAAALIESVVSQVDTATPTVKASAIRAKESWPPYKLSAELPLVAALNAAATKLLGKPVPVKVVGPSNIGNYLAGHGIPAICGFGVNYKNMHAANECLEIASLDPTYRIYAAAIETLLIAAAAPDSAGDAGLAATDEQTIPE